MCARVTSGCSSQFSITLRRPFFTIHDPAFSALTGGALPGPHDRSVPTLLGVTNLYFVKVRMHDSSNPPLPLFQSSQPIPVPTQHTVVSL